jgi:ABC-type molybdate transport system ATPase subunit
VNNLNLIDLSVERDGRAILQGCSATYPAGRRSVLWGRSGEGKTTLLGAIAGLVTPRRGRIELGSTVFFSTTDGIDVAPHRRRIGYVFQDLALWPHLTAWQQVHLVGRTVGLGRGAAAALLEGVGLSGMMKRRPGELSGGEQQRLAIARALAGNPSMLLLDEPFASVDRETRRSLYELIRDASSRIPGPTIYVTHNAEDAQSLAECAFRLEAGVVVEANRPWEDSAR